MTLPKALHPRDDIDRLHVSRKEGERLLVSIEESFDESMRILEDHLKMNKYRLIKATRNSIDKIKINQNHS